MPVLLESVKFPEPVISIAIEPETMSDRDKLMETLDVLSHEDPTFTYRDDAETGQLVISGMGELHLDVLVQESVMTLKFSAASVLLRLHTAKVLLRLLMLTFLTSVQSVEKKLLQNFPFMLNRVKLEKETFIPAA